MIIHESIQAIFDSGKPYVYELCFPSGKPFYVGKGRYKRASIHIQEALQGKTMIRSEKYEVIRSILKRKQEVIIRIDSVHETDAQALNREQLLIFEYGRRENQSGSLTNIHTKTTRKSLIHALINQRERVTISIIFRSTADHTAEEWKTLFEQTCANLGQSKTEVLNEFVREFVLDPPVLAKKSE
jgi:hypothetical protein